MHAANTTNATNAATLRFDADVLAMFMKKVYQGFDVSSEIEPTIWREIVRIINEGTVDGLSQTPAPPTHDQMFYQALRHSNEVFAAFKVHAMANAMAVKLYDASGNLKPFNRWRADISSIASHHTGTWLRTEYDTAVIRAHAAADWQEFERNKDIMPNLRWMPTTSPNPEGSHRKYWETGLTLPVDDPFWNEQHPGNRWNCKCSLEATDDPVNRPENFTPTKPQRGLENNPGKDGHTFNDTHPYFPDKCSKCFAYKKSGLKNRLKGWFKNQKKDCYNCPFIDGCLDRSREIKSMLRQRAKEIRQQVTFLKDTKLENSAFAHKVTVSGASIKEWLNQPHEHFKEKNEVLLSIQDVFKSAKYLGYTKDVKQRNDVEWSHVFEISIGNEKSWILVHEMKWGEYLLHSVSDSPNVTKGIIK